jgi:alpha-L-fucosidase
MQMRTLLLSRRHSLISFLLLQGIGIALLHAQSAVISTAPTASTLSPEQLDRQWIAATAAFAPQRARVLSALTSTTAAGPFRPDWDSLATYRVPDWFRDAKFGIFVHWGVFSVPAFGSEWYSRNMYLPPDSDPGAASTDPAAASSDPGAASTDPDHDYAHHLATFGPQATFGYKDFIPRFRMERFDPAAWATLFRRAGARYVVPVAEHHDGFALYASHLTEWNAVAMGPHRDLFGDLATAVRAQGMKLGASSHRAEHDWFFDGGRTFASDVNDPRFAGLYGPAQQRRLESTDDAAVGKDFTYVSTAFREDWLARTAEIVQLYHPDLLYFDWWVGSPDFRETERTFAAFYYDYAAQHHQPVVMNYKFNNMRDGSGVLDVERGELPGIRQEPWQTDTSLSNQSWGYIDNDTYKQPEPLIHELIDVVSKNGNLLLNIGPRSDGTIPEAAQQTLLAIGAWLDTNGEAIYATRPWTRFGEGPTLVPSGSFEEKDLKPFTPADFRFTTRDGFLYAIELGWPTTREAVIHSLPSTTPVDSVTLLGNPQPLTWHQASDGLHIDLPAAPIGKYAFTFKIKLSAR